MPFAALVVLAAIAPFNVSAINDPWTDALLRPLLVAALGVGLVIVAAGVEHSGWRFGWFEGLALGWVVAIWLSAALSEDPSYGSAGATRISVAIVLALATRATVQTRDQAITVLRALAVGTVAAAVIGLLVLRVGSDTAGTDNLVGSITTLGPWDRLTRPWQHANVAAMAMGATVATVALIRQRVLWAGALVLIVIAMVLTYSRGGLVAAGAVGAAWMLLRRKRADALLVGGLAIVGVVTVLAAPAWSVRLEQPSDEAWYSARIDAAPIAVQDGNGSVEVTVANESRVTWPSTGSDRVLISARWLDPEQGTVWAEQQWELPADLEPGDRITAQLAVEASIPEGSYDVWWDLTIPLSAYFGQFLGADRVIEQGVVAGIAAPGEHGETVEPYPVVERAINLDRGEIRTIAWDAFVDNPLLGVGPLQLATDGVDLASDERFPGGHAHNILLEPLATWGLVGTVPFVALALGAFGQAAMVAWRRRDVVAIVVTVSLFGVGVHGLVDWPMVFVAVGIPVGILLALGWSTERWIVDVAD